MLEKFLGLRIKGRCFEQTTALEFFPECEDKRNKKKYLPRMSMVFGRNGSGKSTVSRTFARFAVDGQKYDGMEMVDILDRDHPIVAVSISGLVEHKDMVKVFNEDYVREKVVLENGDAKGLSTIVLFGERTAYDNKIKELTAERDEIAASVMKCKQVLADFEDEKNPNSLPAIRQAIISTLRNDEMESGWAYRNAEIAGPGTPPSDVTDETVRSILEASSADSGKVNLGEFNKKMRARERITSQIEHERQIYRFGHELEIKWQRRRSQRDATADNAGQEVEHSTKNGVRLAQERAKIESELITLNSQLAKKEIARDYKMLLARESKRDETLEELQKLTSTLQEKDSEIDYQKRSARKDITIAADRINAALKYIFLSDKRIQLEAQDGVYKVKSHGRDVAPYDVSVGERNVLALCYFFADLFKGGNAKDSYKDERLVVLDDPVSSFDHENKMGVLSYIMHEVANLMAGNAETRVICLMHELYSFMALATSINAHDKSVPKEQKIGQVLLALDSKKANMEDKFGPVDNINEYKRNFQEVFEYAKQDEKDLKEDIHVGNQARRLLEAFSTFVFRKGVEHLFFGEVIPGTDDDAKKYRKHFKTVFTRFVVNDESHLQGRIRSLADADSLFPFVDETERQRAVRGAICLIYLILPQHVVALFDGDAENNKKLIQSWLKDIRDNTPLTSGE